MEPAPNAMRRILLVASSENFRRTIGRILARCGYATDLACSGAAATQALDHETYDLVVSEMSLPDMGALSVLSAAREHGHTVPFVLLSEFETERMRWIVSGMDSVQCLSLPVDIDQLKCVLARQLGVEN